MKTLSRVVGSGFTAIIFNGKPIALLDSFTDSGQRPLGPGTETIHVLGTGKQYQRPTEIATTRVVDAGTLTVTIREAWTSPVWEYIGQLAGANVRSATNIAEVQTALDALPGTGLTISMVITPPGTTVKRGKTYHGLVLTDMDDRESITVGGLTVTKSLTFMYTHTTPYA